MPQYFLGKREEARINGLIARAIKDADAAGVRVFGLGALNKVRHSTRGEKLKRASWEPMNRAHKGVGQGSGRLAPPTTAAA